jgi:hypothetical protein
MRSEPVFVALAHVSNRLLLTKLAAMATRKLPRPNTRKGLFFSGNHTIYNDINNDLFWAQKTRAAHDLALSITL